MKIDQEPMTNENLRRFRQQLDEIEEFADPENFPSMIKQTILNSIDQRLESLVDLSNLLEKTNDQVQDLRKNKNQIDNR